MGQRAERLRLIDQVLGNQLGLISMEQFVALGFGAATVRSRVGRGLLERVLPSVYSQPGIPQSWEREVLAACLWAGDSTAASFGCSARIWGWKGFVNAAVEISTTSSKRDRHIAFRVHRNDGFLIPDVRRQGPLPVTSVERTLMDLAGKKHQGLQMALNQALRERHTSLGSLGRSYEEAWRRGRRGIAVMRTLLLDRLGVSAPTDSELEDMFVTLLRSASLPEPQRQFPVNLQHGPIRLDFAYPRQRIAIELDGYQWHSDRPSFESDRRRDNALTLMGWVVIRVTWMMLRHEPVAVLELVRHHLSERSGLHSNRLVKSAR